MNKKLLWILAVTSMLSAGNVYYAQPLLGDLARTFGVTDSDSSLIPVLTQIGYVLGLIFITPLGDIIEKKKIILILLGFEAVVLFGASVVPRFGLFEMIALAIGASSVLVQIIFPFVAVLSGPKDRAKNLGFVVGSALVGILLSRAISGFVAALIGWHWIYLIAGVLHVVLATALYFMLPKYEADTKLAYPKLIYSLWQLTRELPKLRAVAINGMLLYAGLSAFWASLIFFLESDTYHLGTKAAGSFGFIGAMGAATASSIGGLIDKHGSKRVLRLCMLFMAGSFAVMAIWGGSFVGLIAGVVFLDIGAQGATVTNQNELYTIHASAQTRLNTIYKIFYFVGGAMGSAASAIAWHSYKWPGVCIVGLFFIAAATIWDRYSESIRSSPSPGPNPAKI